jgi:hypothetical protein
MSSRRGTLALSFAITTAVLAVLTVLATGAASIKDWVAGMAGYSNAITTSPSVASLSGLYARWAPSGLRFALEAAATLTAVALTTYLWRAGAGKGQLEVLAVGWLWFAWFLAAPYAHFYDEILLTLPLLALLGRNGERLAEAGPTLALYLAFFSLLVLSATPGGVQLLCVPLLAIAYILYRRASPALTAQPS